MGNLAKSELISLLAKKSQEVSNNEMQQAYETFLKEVETLNQSETDFMRAGGKMRLKICTVRKQSGISITRLSP